MLLRASGEREDASFDLTAVTDDSRDSGVPHGAELLRLTELAIGGDRQALAAAREAASAVMGRQQMVDALVVAAAFNGITRVADCTGIPLDENTEATTVDMRAMVGLDAFDYREKTRRFG